MLAKLIVLAGVVALAALGAPASGRSASDAAVPAGAGYVAPVPEPLDVLRGFSPPVTPYGPGHLGVDLRGAAGEIVRAATGGMVRFAGQVAGRGVVVVMHPDGIRTEYEPVAPLVRVGDPVITGQPIGTLRGRHAGCARPCLHWGARRGDTYVDPLGLLRPLGPVVLLPWLRGP